jgi:ribosome-binding protein aMBF1 (putative translation factor)
MTGSDEFIKTHGISNAAMEQAQSDTRAYLAAYSLREARRAQGLTQKELARKTGISQNRISRMENGDLASMSIDTISRYVKALGGAVELVATLPSGTVTIK